MKKESADCCVCGKHLHVWVYDDGKSWCFQCHDEYAHEKWLKEHPEEVKEWGHDYR